MSDNYVDPFDDGLEKLLRMKPLDGFDFDRWAQIRRDCTKLLKDYGAQIREYGWELSDIFGYTRGAHINQCGLGLYLSGGTVTRFKPRDVLVWKPVSQGMGGK